MRFGKEETGSEEKRLREQRGLVPSRPVLTRLRQPYLFSRKRKDRGEKSAWMRLMRSASEFKQAPSFGLAFHMVLTLWASYYAPPDTGVSSLRLVAVERLPSIEGAMEIWMGKTSLRADSSVAALPGRLLFHKGALGLCRNGWKRNYSAGKKSFWLILGGGYAIINYKYSGVCTLRLSDREGRTQRRLIDNFLWNLHSKL